MNLMIITNNPLKLLFLTLILFPFFISSKNIPTPLAKPVIVEKKFQDIFNEIKKQNWQMAKILAKEYNNKNLYNYVVWLDMTRPGSAHKFSELYQFLKENKNWPSNDEIKKKIELSITPTTKKEQILSWFDKNPPLTVKGSIDYAEAKFKIEKKIDSRIIKEIWINKNLTYKQQKYFISKYSRYWNTDDNWARFDRLLWEGKLVSAKRTLMRIKGDLRKLGDARLALSKRSGNVSKFINNVPDHLKNDPGLIYERMRWRRKAKLDTAEEFLFDPPIEIKNYRKWWINARIVVRRLLNKKKYSKAYKILVNHKIPIDTISGAEAEWMAGWVALSFLNSPEKASKHFASLFNNVKNEKSKSIAAYWMAKSLEKDNKNNWKNWYNVSSENIFNYYGQKSLKKLNRSMKLFDEEIIPEKPINIDHLLEIINILKSSGEEKRIYPFLEKCMELSTNISQKLYILNLASSNQDKSLIVRLSKKFNVNNYLFAYPNIIDRVPEKFIKNENDLAIIHAIILQESAFKINAKSHAGARGLMQLMPLTAKRVSASLGIKYYRNALTRNPNYNILLGTTYIKKLLKDFNNSMPLALAGYNAGPGRVKIWLKRYGDPRKKEISYENWIESIPIYETRNYVKKVLANYIVYKKIFVSHIFNKQVTNLA